VEFEALVILVQRARVGDKEDNRGARLPPSRK
jgi:hypothetical protein